MNLEETIETMMQSVALGESLFEDDFIIVDSELGNDATYDYCDDVFSVSSSGDDSSVRCLSVSSNLPSIREKVIFFEDVEEASEAHEKDRHVPAQVEFDASSSRRHVMTRELSSPSIPTINSEELSGPSYCSDEDIGDGNTAVGLDTKTEERLVDDKDDTSRNESNRAVTRVSNETSLAAAEEKDHVEPSALERDLEAQKTESSLSTDTSSEGSDEIKPAKPPSSSAEVEGEVAGQPKKEISRLSNKKRRKKMKLIKKAAAAAAAAAALTEMTRSGVVHQVGAPAPPPKRGATRGTRTMGRKSNKVANIAVVAATESMTAYRKEVAEQKKRNKKGLRSVAQRVQPMGSSLS